MIPRSTNCAAYTDTISLLVEARAKGAEERCAVDLSAFSCQKSAFEAPDDATEATLRTAAEERFHAMDCDAGGMALEFTTSLVGAQTLEFSATQLVDMGKVSNCKDGDINDAGFVGRATCTAQYDMTDAQGRTVRNTNMRTMSSLRVCDPSDEAMPQVMEDLRKVAAHNLEAKGYTVARPEDLACTFSILPV